MLGKMADMPSSYAYTAVMKTRVKRLKALHLGLLPIQLVVHLRRPSLYMRLGLSPSALQHAKCEQAPVPLVFRRCVPRALAAAMQLTRDVEDALDERRLRVKLFGHFKLAALAVYFE